MASIWERFLVEVDSSLTSAIFMAIYKMHDHHFVKQIPIHNVLFMKAQYKKEFCTAYCSSSCTVCHYIQAAYMTNTNELLKLDCNQ
jgi:biotin synthase-like enzyme